MRARLLMRNVGQSLLLTLLLLIPARDAIPAADHFTGKVVGVHDGDTITVLQDRTPVKVRLFGIDCPETGQDFGSRAKAAIADLLEPSGCLADTSTRADENRGCPYQAGPNDALIRIMWIALSGTFL